MKQNDDGGQSYYIFDLTTPKRRRVLPNLSNFYFLHFFCCLGFNLAIK